MGKCRKITRQYRENAGNVKEMRGKTWETCRKIASNGGNNLGKCRKITRQYRENARKCDGIARKYRENAENVMVGRGNERKSMGQCCENAGNMMVWRGNERKNMGKCRKTASNGGNRTCFMEIVENTVKTKEM